MKLDESQGRWMELDKSQKRWMELDKNADHRGCVKARYHRLYNSIET